MGVRSKKAERKDKKCFILNTLKMSNTQPGDREICSPCNSHCCYMKSVNKIEASIFVLVFVFHIQR